MRILMIFSSLANIFNRYKPMSNGITSSPVVTSIEHHCLHEGGCYRAFTSLPGMAKDDTLSVCFKTPATGWGVHVKGYVWGSYVAGKIEIIEGAIWDSGTGAKLGLIQRNRKFTENSVLLEDSTGAFVATNNLLVNPTNIAGGKVLDLDSTIIKKSATPIVNNEEQPLKKDTTYIFKITSNASDNIAEFKIYWDEHKEK